MIEIQTTNKNYSVDMDLKRFDEFLASGEQFLQVGGVRINKSFIIGVEENVELYFDGYLLDAKGTHFFREGDKIWLTPEDKKRIEYRQITSNKKLNGSDTKKLQGQK